MDTETRIRSRFEAILQGTGRKAGRAEAPGEYTPLQVDSNREELNLYQQIIHIYRGAVDGVNQRLLENSIFMSSLSRIFESIREKEDFHEVCSRIVDCVLRDLGVEYCGILFFRGSEQAEIPFSLEGVREGRRFLRFHSDASLLRSKEFEETVASLALESPETVNVGDVYLDLRFSNVDLPSVVRSLVCVPIVLNSTTIGALVLSHSQPLFFQSSLIQVFEILANAITHLRLLLGRRSKFTMERAPVQQVSLQRQRVQDVISIILFDFDLTDGFGRDRAIDNKTLEAIRTALESTLEGKEFILFQGGAELLALLPGVLGEQLPHRVTRMWEAFDQWKKNQQGPLQNSRVSLGFSTCEEGQNLVEALEIASLMMHPEPDKEVSLSS